MFLCQLCASVVCARVSPRQKSLVVNMVRTASPSAVTLSVGDGANDVPMLQVQPEYRASFVPPQSTSAL